MKNDRGLDLQDLDAYITGHGGEDQLDDTLELCEQPVTYNSVCGALETRECPFCSHFFCEQHINLHRCEGMKGTRWEE